MKSKSSIEKELRTILETSVSGTADAFLICRSICSEDNFLAFFSEKDRDYIISLSSQIDRFPLGRERSMWNAGELKKLDKELKRFRQLFEDDLKTIFRRMLSDPAA